MANENVVDEFLNGLNNEVKDDPFTPESNDPFATQEETKEEVKEEAKEGGEEEKLPYHQDPKIQKYIDKQISKRLAEKPVERVIERVSEVEKFTKETSDDDFPLVRVIGNDTPEKVQAVKDLKKYLDGVEERGAQRALKELEQRSLAEQREDREAENELTQGFESVEEQFGVDLTSNTPTAKKFRSDFVDFITRVAPKDEYGQVTDYPDFQETFQLFRDINKPVAQSNNRAKELASRSIQRSGDASVVPKNKEINWKTIDQMFG